MSELVTTLNKIRAHGPCKEGWEKLLRHLGKTQADDEPLPFSVILESNGLYDALWCCRSAPEYNKEWRLFAVWCARQVQHLMKDPRSLNAIDVAERYAYGNATDEELEAARYAARDAARDAESAAAWDAAWDAAVNAARNAAWHAAGNAAWDAARDAESAAAWDAAWDAAVNAAWHAAGNAAWDAQKEQFIKVIKGV